MLSVNTPSGVSVFDLQPEGLSANPISRKELSGGWLAGSPPHLGGADFLMIRKKPANAQITRNPQSAN
jgi:hypothetical protein